MSENMSENTEKSFGQEFVQEAAKAAAGKAVLWGPAILGALLLGPAGILLGVATSVGILTSACSKD
jgi:hypothetical protein